MRDCNLLARFVIDFRARRLRQEFRDVLDQRSIAKNIQTLQAVADAEHGLTERVSVLEQQVVYLIAPRVGGGSMRRSLLPKPDGIDVGITARQKDAIATFNQF